MTRAALLALALAGCGTTVDPESGCRRQVNLVRYVDGMTCERHYGLPWDVMCSPPYPWTWRADERGPAWVAHGMGGFGLYEWGVSPRRGLFLGTQCQRPIPEPLPEEEMRWTP